MSDPQPKNGDLSTDIWVQELEHENGSCVVTATGSPMGHGADGIAGKVSTVTFRVHLRDAPRLKQRLRITITSEVPNPEESAGV